MKLIGSTAAGCLFALGGSAGAIPIADIQEADDMGSHADTAFAGQRLGNFRADSRTTHAGRAHAVRGTAPQPHQFTRAAFNRHQGRFPSTSAAPSVLPGAMGLGDPDAFHLMRWDSTHSTLFSNNITRCENGWNRYSCLDAAAFFGAAAPHAFEPTHGHGVMPSLSFDLTPQQGEARPIEGASDGASLQAKPIPEPGIAALMLAGVGLVVMALRRRMGRRDFTDSDAVM